MNKHLLSIAFIFSFIKGGHRGGANNRGGYLPQRQPQPQNHGYPAQSSGYQQNVGYAGSDKGMNRNFNNNQGNGRGGGSRVQGGWSQQGACKCYCKAEYCVRYLINLIF